MKRKLRWLLILVILAAFGVWLEPTRVIWGWLRGEAFYDGRPTSWWALELENWEAQSTGSTIWMDQYGSPPDLNATYWRSPSPWEQWFTKFINVKAARGSCSVVTDGNPAAAPVLLVLADSPSRKLRWMTR